MAMSLGVAASFAPQLADAHIIITSHQTRYGRSEIKEGPCGREGGAPGEYRYTYAPGATIAIVFDEFIDHPGYFRVAFDDEGDDDFVDPVEPGDFFTNATVLMDPIQDGDGGKYRIDVTLPDIECDQCTLQLVQVMTDKPPYGDGNDLYYNCIDLELVEGSDPTDTTGFVTAETGDAEGEGPGTDADTSGCACDAGSGTGGSAWALGLLVLLGLRGRRRREGR